MNTLATVAALPDAPAIRYFKPCACLGAAPGRSCRHCMSFHWLKLCDVCWGDGVLRNTPRQASSPTRTERCGKCSGAGWTPCPKKEIPEAEQEAKLLLMNTTAQGMTMQPEPGLAEALSIATVEIPSARTPARRQQLKRSQQRRRQQPGLPSEASRQAAQIAQTAQIAAPEPAAKPEATPEPELLAAEGDLGGFTPDDFSPAS